MDIRRGVTTHWGKGVDKKLLITSMEEEMPVYMINSNHNIMVRVSHWNGRPLLQLWPKSQYICSESHHYLITLKFDEPTSLAAELLQARDLFHDHLVWLTQANS